MFGQGYKGPCADSPPPYNGASDGSVGINTPKTRSPVERVSSSLNDARELSAHVRVIVDTLIGGVSETCGNDPKPPHSGGIVTALADHAEDTAAQIRQAQSDLHRLSQVMGLGV